MAAFEANLGTRWLNDSSFRHCERSEAIHSGAKPRTWIASSLTLLAMTEDATVIYWDDRQKEGPRKAGLRRIGGSTDPKSDQAVLL